MPRPTKLTPDVHDSIVQTLRAGNYFDAACYHAGITEKTGYNWLARGEAELARMQRATKHTEPQADEAIYVAFLQAVKKATSEAEVEAVAKMKAGYQMVNGERERIHDWQRIAWWLERRYPRKWGRQTVQHEHSGTLTWKQVIEEAAVDGSDDPYA